MTVLQPVLTPGGCYDSPHGIVAMVTDGVTLSAAFEPVSPDRLSPVELWDCPHPELWAHDCRHLLGVFARERRSDCPRTAPRLVSRWYPQKWGQTGRQAPHAGGLGLFCPLT